MIATTIAALLREKGSKIYSVGPEASAYEAIAEMATHNIASVLVMVDGKLEGIFSAKDYGTRVVLAGKNGKDVAVGDIMTHPVLTTTPEVKLMDAMQIMTEKGIRHLPIAEDGKLLGVVTLGDIARQLMADKAFKIDQLMKYIGS